MLSECPINTTHLFALVFERAPIGMTIVSPDGNIQKVNQSLCHMFGYQTDELINQRFQSLTHPEDLDLNLDLFQQALDGVIDKYEMVKRFYHKSGRIVSVLLRTSLVRDDQGNPAFFISQLVDITEQKRYESQLKENEERYKSLIQNAPVAISALDLEGNFIEANPALEQMLGYSSQELKSMNFKDFVVPERVEVSMKMFEDSLREPLKFDQFYIKRLDGSIIDAVTVSSPIIVNGETIGVYYMIRDITQERQTEERMKNQEKLLLVGELAAGIAHEIRNPLTSLRGFIQLFELEETSDIKKSRYNIMRLEIDRINEIVSELLILAKPSQEQYNLRSITDMLDNVIVLLEAQANLKDIQIKKAFESELPFVNCNSGIKQVFINLLKNAMESMSDGGEIVVQATRIRDNICIQIKDQGGGISDEHLSKLGQPFFTTKETGTGLGLMVSQRIVQNHGGTLLIKSGPGEGTIVEITLPLPEDKRGNPVLTSLTV